MFLLILWLMFAGIGAMIGNSKGNPAGGVFWGLLLGPLGWLVVASIPDDRPRCADCLSILMSGARKCRYCGSKQPDVTEVTPSSILHRSWGNVFAVGLLGLAVFCLGGLVAQLNALGDNAKATFESVAGRLETEPSHWPKDSVTLSQYTRLSEGMSYRQVRNIFGDPGTEVSGSRLEGIPVSMESVAYSWSNGDGSNVLVIFLNGKLMHKSQAGLR